MKSRCDLAGRLGALASLARWHFDAHDSVGAAEGRRIASAMHGRRAFHHASTPPTGAQASSANSWFRSGDLHLARRRAMGTAFTPKATPSSMVWIAGGRFLMGSDHFYPEEQPAHHSSVDGFWIDPHPVTTAEFSRFVQATGYVTVAERPLDPAGYPGADPAALIPGSLVFRRPHLPVPLHDYRAWWAYVAGASWRHPEGSESTVDGREQHPVTHVAYEDALAYARWAGKDLPTEAEWEFLPAEDYRTPCMSGATTSPRAVACSPTRGRVVSRGRTCGSTGSKARRPSMRFLRMGTACTTWRGTSGSGRATSSRPGIHRLEARHAARRPTRTAQEASRSGPRVLRTQCSLDG